MSEHTFTDGTRYKGVEIHWDLALVPSEPRKYPTNYFDDVRPAATYNRPAPERDWSLPA